MAPRASRDLLDHLLEGSSLSADELDAFISAVEREDLFLDYKDGKLTGKPPECRQVVREWVSGFANAEGGVLILGVSEDEPRGISPCQQIGKEALDVWAQKVLSDMVGFFSPQPRFQVVRHPQGEVLLIAVARAPQLVPCIESRETKYFLRFHDSTREVPPYLISDLVLGRRNHPVLVPEFEDPTFQYEDTQEIAWRTGRISFGLSVVNSSFVMADDIEAGIVGWTFTQSNVLPVSTHLRSHLDVESPTGSTDADEQPTWKLMRAPSKVTGRSGQALAPFDTLRLVLGGFWVPRFRYRIPAQSPGQPPMLFRCGLYILAAGSSPAWFQVDLTVADLPTQDRSDPKLTFPKSYLSVGRLASSRPVIAWREKT